MNAMIDNARKRINDLYGALLLTQLKLMEAEKHAKSRRKSADFVEHFYGKANEPVRRNGGRNHDQA